MLLIYGFASSRSKFAPSCENFVQVAAPFVSVVPMFPDVDTKFPTAVEREVQHAYLQAFPQGDRLFIPRVFGWAIACFSGDYADYQAIDARYHDFEHTLQGTLCMGRLLLGRHRAQAQPELTEKFFQLGIIGILLHDTGYLKKRDDTEGTGAKYTAVHVQRSAEFAAGLLADKGFSEHDIRAVQNMIRCTGVDAELTTIPFQSELEKTVGQALATADLLGQMAAADYVDKLPTLYMEFAEATRHNPAWASSLNCFASADDLMRNTPHFWSDYVWPRINGDFQKLYQFLNDPYPNGANPYLAQVEQNLARLAILKK